MERPFLAQFLALFLLMTLCVGVTCSQEYYYITPSLDHPCIIDFICITLKEFAANFSKYFDNNQVNVSVFLLPGSHILDRELALADVDNFSIAKLGNTQTSSPVYIECVNESGRFTINKTTFASIKALRFIGCGGNSVSEVGQLIVTDTFFQGVEGKGTTLTLSKVTSATIIGSYFNSSTHHGFYMGGALYAAFSNVIIHSSKFLHNSAIIGGALFANHSRLHIARCTCSGNRAAYGAVIVTSESTVIFDEIIFSQNEATLNGGVLVSFNSLFTISTSVFTNNMASDNGGVLTICESSFTIANSAFMNNSASLKGGVVTIEDDSLLSISNSTFINNSAGVSGGVVVMSGNSSFSITNGTFTDNSAGHGGVIDTSDNNSSFVIIRSIFVNNSADSGGVVCVDYESSVIISNSAFINNSAHRGGVLCRNHESSIIISNSAFINNSVTLFGGVIQDTQQSSLHITNSIFTNNSATEGGVIATESHSLLTINNCSFINNRASKSGGVMHISFTGLVNIVITNSVIADNSATYWGGVIMVYLIAEISFTITNSVFTNNSVTAADYGGGGVMFTRHMLFLSISNSAFINNSAATSGGVMLIVAESSIVNITNSTFSNNCAAKYGGVMSFTSPSLVTITSSTFTKNSAARIAGIFNCRGGSLNVDKSTFNFNTADDYGGIIFMTQCYTQFTMSIFNNNLGSLYAFNSNLTFSGSTVFENSTEPLLAKGLFSRQQGGAITSFQSTVIFTGQSRLLSNQASRGGAVLAIESVIIMHGKITIANNMAKNGSGGGISLHQSDLKIRGHCSIFNNSAVRGGGVHAISSTVVVHPLATLQFISNSAIYGGGICLEVNPKLYILVVEEPLHRSYGLLKFIGNHGNYGGAVYVADDTNSGACSPDMECFFQSLSLYSSMLYNNIFDTVTVNVYFSGNTATEQGHSIFGGLLDRCTPSAFAEVYQTQYILYYSGITYMGKISNIALDSIASQPVRLCFCFMGQPVCGYQPPTVRVKKGETFTVTVVAVDQVNHTVDANVTSSLSSSDGGFDEGQQTQKVLANCTDLTFNVFSPHEYETINLFPDGPCPSAILSASHVIIHFNQCTCPVGFEVLSNSQSETRCECICDSKLSPYITDCNSTTSSLLRVNTNSWIIYSNDTDPPGYVIYPYCPFDYCLPPTDNVSINLNLPNGGDSQCAYNHQGVLCGSCQENFSLSLGSSRCLPSQNHWSVVVTVVLIAVIIGGVLLVTAMLALNITVAIGLINVFIFYANIVTANSSAFFPSSEPSFPTVFVAWLNLDIGFDVFLFDGLDAYTKTWLQLGFPIYIISLVIIIVKISKHSTKFVRLISKKDPIATLATLILLSYAKLLSVTIAALSFAVLQYPDGSQDIVWLPDGNVKYCQGKHIPLVLVALFIIIVGLPYTVLLFLWQWLIRIAPSRWKIFRWTRSTRLNTFIATYHAPFNSRYRCWTGLLLIVRAVLYITASFTVSSSPQTLPLLTIILVGGLFLVKGVIGLRVYKSLLVDLVDTVICFNILILAAFSLCDFKNNVKKQTAAAYISTLLSFILLVGAFVYHGTLLIKRAKPIKESNNYYPMTATQPDEANHENLITSSVIELPMPDQYPQEINQF